MRVPEENIISGTKGNGDLVISKAFTWSGPVAAIAAVGVARAAYEYTLEWANGHTAGGAQPIMQHQHVGYLLSDVAMKIEAARYLSWKSAQYLDLYDSEGHVPGAWSKIFGGETCVEVVYTCMRIMGVNSYDRSHPLEKYMREALCFPTGVFFAGVIGDTLGGVVSDYILRRSGARNAARRNIIVIGLLGGFLFLLPVMLVHDINVAAISLATAFFFIELSIAPMWAVPMDIAPKYSGRQAA